MHGPCPRHEQGLVQIEPWVAGRRVMGIAKLLKSSFVMDAFDYRVGCSFEMETTRNATFASHRFEEASYFVAEGGQEASHASARSGDGIGVHRIAQPDGRVFRSERHVRQSPLRGSELFRGRGWSGGESCVRSVR